MSLWESEAQTRRKRIDPKLADQGWQMAGFVGTIPQDDLGEPEEIITEVITQLTAAIDELNQVLRLLEKPERVGV